MRPGAMAAVRCLRSVLGDTQGPVSGKQELQRLLRGEVRGFELRYLEREFRASELPFAIELLGPVLAPPFTDLLHSDVRLRLDRALEKNSESQPRANLVALMARGSSTQCRLDRSGEGNAASQTAAGR